MGFRSITSVLVGLVALAVGALTANAGERLDFSRDIRPILADACFHCHGADAEKRQAELRLDSSDNALADRHGTRVITPGDADHSELYRRISSSDPDEQMPPPESVRTLTRQEKAAIRRWIEQGATWQEHWSFVPPQRPAVPKVSDKEWPIHDLDRFVLARLDDARLQPSPGLERNRLLRRVTLDLTGLPPTLQEIDDFLKDDSPAAYERVVDRLLKSDRYGEHMAALWLDLARYADTDGYQDDEPRTMWRWREWLIDTLNDNLPYDRFTTQLLAGDMLPEATPEQRLATGFLRNNRVNGEGGSIAEEFRVEYIIDRVETASSVWLGLTTGCARCHDHKYDPITQKEFYQLFAFFNQIPEPGRYRRSAKPSIKVPSRWIQRQLDAIDRRLAEADDASDEHRELSETKAGLLESVPETMVMEDTESRSTFVLARGQYDQPGETVMAGVPSMLPAMRDDVPRNRLSLARWLTDPNHPLTARVMVNRIWQFHFGTGLVRTAEDFGVRGDLPSHAELLDFLSTEFVTTGWDVKAVQRMIVTSATYRQTAECSDAVRSADPDNRLLSRGPGIRLSAEVIRDQALFVSGLLVEQIGGPSVKPYQPAKMWLEIAGVTTSAYKDGYVQATGDDLYRRSIYTFWRRAIPPPGMQIFDAPGREVCAARRESTNTPLQALALMNDVTYVEAARALGARMIREGGDTPADRAVFGFRLVTARKPSPRELDILLRGLNRHLETYQVDRSSAADLTHVGDSSPDSQLDVAELAAFTALASTLLNLHETINKP
ncbi:MAG: PSD1 and planctomycete cytochrome C domain-containing protein [Planctomycetaceae bacterium]